MTDTELRDSLGQLKHDVLEAATRQNDELQNALNDLDKRFDKLEADYQTARLTSAPKADECSKAFRDYLTSGKIDEAYLNTATEGTTGNSGVLIPKPLVERIIEYSRPGNPLRELADVVTISRGDSYLAASTDGEVGGGWVKESDSRAQTDSVTFSSITIPAEEMFAQPGESNRLLEDADYNLEDRILRACGRTFSKYENIGFFNGTGSTYGQPKGILTYELVDNADWVAGKIGKATAASASAITGDELINLQDMLDDEYRDNARWIVAPATWTYIRQLKAGTNAQNRYLLWTPDLVDGRLVRTLLGSPVHFSSQMGAVESGAISVAYGDFRAAYTIVDKITQVSLIRDVYTKKGWTLFYVTKRTGGAATNTQAVKFLVQAGSSSSSSSSEESSSSESSE